MSTNILMVVTSNDRLGDHGATGTWLEELPVRTTRSSMRYTRSALRRHKEAMHGSLQEPWLTSTGRRFQQDARATAALKRTLPIEGVAAAISVPANCSRWRVSTIRKMRSSHAGSLPREPGSIRISLQIRPGRFRSASGEIGA
ncbi:MAG TPA: hypothetical protein VGD45_08190 [Steroidobacter sp.]